MKAYSLDLRQRVVQAVDEGCTAEEAAALFEISPATVRRYLSQRRRAGTLVPKTSPGRPRLISAADEMALQAQVAERPDGFLEEHCLLWQQRMGRAVSVATMCRALARLRLQLKKRPFTLKNKTQKSALPGGTR
jgi:transposase